MQGCVCGGIPLWNFWKGKDSIFLKRVPVVESPPISDSLIIATAYWNLMAVLKTVCGLHLFLGFYANYKA